MLRTTPWNQIGTDITGIKNINMALQVSNLDFEVVKNPIFDNNGNTISGWFANTNISNGDVLGIVKKNYQIVNNNEAFDFVDSLVDEGVEFERAGQFHYGRASWILGKMPRTDILADTFDPYLLFTNSFDGTGSIKVAIIPLRIACSNAINMALKRANRTWSTRHIGNINGKLEEAKYTLGLADNYMTALKEEANRLVAKKMSNTEFKQIVDRVLPIDTNKDSARKIRNIEDIKSAIYSCLQAPDLANFNGTAWGYLQATTDALDHLAPVRTTENYAENNWFKIANGHNLVDNFYNAISA
jgi:phage/plasmid-like protein (TIGR03299 family)